MVGQVSPALGTFYYHSLGRQELSSFAHDATTDFILRPKVSGHPLCGKQLSKFDDFPISVFQNDLSLDRNDCK